MPIPEYLHIIKLAEIGFMCDSIVIEKDIQLGAAEEIIIGQSVTIEEQNKKLKRLFVWVQILGVAVIIETAVIMIMILAT